MLKLFITAIDSREDGTAVTLFEDYVLAYDSKEEVGNSSIATKLSSKIEEVEKINNQVTSPF